MIRVMACLLLTAAPVFAQEVADASAAKLRLLDKLTGAVTDLTLSKGQSQSFGRLTVQMDDCRYYPDAPAAEAFVHLTVLETAVKDPVFNGWMTASSPALSALDNPRYDVWPLRCDVADIALPDVEDAPVDDVSDPNADTTDSTDGNGG
jgi:hypothetical protein